MDNYPGRLGCEHDPENPQRSNVIDVNEVGMPLSMPGWPWAPPSVISSASLGLPQEQQQQRDLSSTHPGVNSSPHFLQGYDYNQLESPILRPPQAPPSSISPTQGFPRVPPAPPTQPNPKVAIPRSAGTESASHRRRRSARACEPCRVRKIKCDGNKPVCRQCVENHVSCTYIDVKRVREQKQLGILSRQLERYGGLLKELEPEVDSGAAKKIRRTLKMNGEEEDESESDSSVGSLDAIDLVEEDLNRNEKTRATGFFGKNSEVAWMQKLEIEAKYRSHRTSDNINTPRSKCEFGSHHARMQDVPITLMSYHLDDLEIPLMDEIDPYAVPSKSVADRFFNAYMLVFHPSFHVVRRKTFTAQYERFIRNPETVWPPRKWLAVLNMVFAIGCHYCRLTGCDGVDEEGDHNGTLEDGMVYLTRARKLSLAGNVLFEHSDLQQVQVEFLVAFYLLARGQVNRASKFSSMAFRSALSLGINLRFVDDWTDDGAKEARSRLWWSIYILEHSIAGLTGRVACVSESLSSVSMPVPYEEEFYDHPEVARLFRDKSFRHIVLKPTLFQTDEESRSHGEWLWKCGFSPSLFFFCSVDLVFITQAIINKVYSIEGIRERSGQIEQRIRKYGIKMDNWLAKVPSAYRFTTNGGREAANSETDFFAIMGDQGDEGGGCVRERFSLAMHFYSSKITLYRPCLTHANSRDNAPTAETAPVNIDETDDGHGEADGDRGQVLGQFTKSPSGSNENTNTTSSATNSTNTSTNTSNTAKTHRSRFRTEMSLGCLRAACALISLLPNEPDIISLLRLAPWWHHLHYIMQATTAMLLGLSNWPTSPPVEEKHSSSFPTITTTNPTATATAKPSPTADDLIPTLEVKTVIAATKKALRWLFHLASHGDDAARRAFVLCDSFMRRIASSIGVGVDDLPEAKALPASASGAFPAGSGRGEMEVEMEMNGHGGGSGANNPGEGGE